MSPVEVVLQFSTVFLGAFLAFVLENVRERRRLKGWVRRYVGRFYSDLLEGITAQEDVVKEFRKSTEVYQTFVEATASDGVTPQWKKLLAMYYGMNSDFKILLEGDALRVLPAEVVRAVSELQKVNDGSGVISRLLTDLHGRYIVPIALAKTWPLSDQDRAALAYFTRVADVSLDYQERFLEAMKEVQKTLERHQLVS